MTGKGCLGLGLLLVALYSFLAPVLPEVAAEVSSQDTSMSSAQFNPQISLSAQEKAWIVEHPIIRLGIDPEFAPFEYLNSDGRYSGITSDYITILNQRLGLNMKVVKGLSWKEAVTKARGGEIDVLPCLGRTQERQSFLNYSRPYIHFMRVIVTRSAAPFLRGLDDLHGMKVAVQINSSHLGYLREHSDIQPITYITQQEALLSVAEGGSDAFVGNVASVTYWIRKLNLTNLKIAAPVSSETQDLHFAVRQDWPMLIDIINKGLASLSPVEIDGISRKWVNIDYSPGIAHQLVKRYITWVITVALLILLVVLFWNRRLNREIDRRVVVEKDLQAARVELEERVMDRTEELEKTNQELLCEIAGHRQTEQKLRRSESEWRNTFNSITDFILVIDLNHRILQANKAFADFIKRPLREIVGYYCYEVLHGLDAPIVGCPHLDLIDTGETVSKEIYDERFGIYLQVTDSPIFESGTVVASVHIVKDISAKKKDEVELIRHRDHLEELVAERTSELSEANKILKELDQLKSMFIASMSHELRTPLNSIIGFTGIILQGMTGELNDKQKDHLGRVYASAKHLLNLITDVIDISKVEAGRIDRFPVDFNLIELVEEAVDSIATQLHHKNLTMKVDVPEKLRLHTDRKRLLQCLLNYLSNGVKFTEEGGLSLLVKESSDTVEIQVADSGIGIAEEDIPKLFEAFERLDSHLRVKVGGTGLGLYLTRKLVREILDGEIEVSSNVGEGSVFALIIPKVIE